MSRVLAQLLGAAEPAFSQRVMQLERAAGLPSADIRLMTEIIKETRDKLQQLGLDPHDTTGQELYGQLRLKLLRDEVQVRLALGLRTDSSPEAVVEAVRAYLTKLGVPMQTFAVRTSVMRALLKKLGPRRTQQKLGYRSMDSMLKHEPLPQLLAAASMLESPAWQARRLEAYKRLKPSDFESRKTMFLLPTTKNWPAITTAHMGQIHHNMLTLPELGAVVLFVPKRQTPGLTVATLLLGVENLNEMRASSSWLKLQQTRSDFGSLFVRALAQEAFTATELAGQQLSWKTLHWSYGHGQAAHHVDVFEPHVQAEDFAWCSAEDALAALHPTLEFWQGSQLLGLLDGAGQPVSLNMLDVSLNVCNGLDYAERLVHHMRQGLGCELLAQYLHHDNLHMALLRQLDEPHENAPELT